jgi:single-stranded DNA-binding protein
MNINTVHMTGNLTDDPELRYTPSGKPVVSGGGKDPGKKHTDS